MQSAAVRAARPAPDRRAGLPPARGAPRGRRQRPPRAVSSRRVSLPRARRRRLGQWGECRLDRASRAAARHVAPRHDRREAHRGCEGGPGRGHRPLGRRRLLRAPPGAGAGVTDPRGRGRADGAPAVAPDGDAHARRVRVDGPRRRPLGQPRLPRVARPRAVVCQRLARRGRRVCGPRGARLPRARRAG